MFDTNPRNFTHGSRLSARFAKAVNLSGMAGLLPAKLGVCLFVALASGCGWVDSTGGMQISLEEAIEQQTLTGTGDVIDVIAEEPVLLDTTFLFSQIRNSGNLATNSTVWQPIGNSDLSDCPHLSQLPDTGVSLRQACDLAAYTGTAASAAAVADCSIHFVELVDHPGIFEVNAPAITHPVVLRYTVTATTSAGLGNASELTICLEP